MLRADAFDHADGVPPSQQSDSPITDVLCEFGRFKHGRHTSQGRKHPFGWQNPDLRGIDQSLYLHPDPAEDRGRNVIPGWKEDKGSQLTCTQNRPRFAGNLIKSPPKSHDWLDSVGPQDQRIKDSFHSKDHFGTHCGEVFTAINANSVQPRVAVEKRPPSRLNRPCPKCDQFSITVPHWSDENPV